jgi:hypothetical protein
MTCEESTVDALRRQAAVKGHQALAVLRSDRSDVDSTAVR